MRTVVAVCKLHDEVVEVEKGKAEAPGHGPPEGGFAGVLLSEEKQMAGR
jgi:hypothetical protein